MPQLIRIAVALLALLVAALPARAEMTEAEKEEIGKVIREYLLTNPEVLEEAITVLRLKREQEEALARASAIEDYGDRIFDSEHQIVLGNPDGAITLVEFFDYNCGYCRRALSDMTALLQTNDDLRIVLKEFPILSEGSVEAARIGVAVSELAPERYLDFHIEVFTRPGEANAAKALEVARDLGLDADAVEAAASKSSITEGITEVREIADALGISGTPSYVIGKEIIPGAIGFDGLQQRVAAMRECGLTVC